MAEPFFSETLTKPAAGIAFANRQLTILATTPAFCLLLERESNALIGHSLPQIFPDAGPFSAESLERGVKATTVYSLNDFSVELELQIQPHPLEREQLMITIGVVGDPVLGAARATQPRGRLMGEPGISFAERIVELETLQKIGVAIAANLELETLLVTIVKEAIQLLRIKSCSILLLDEATGDLVHRASVDHVLGARVPPGKGIVQSVLKTGQARIVEDVQADPSHYRILHKLTGVVTRNLMAAPLSVGGQKIGVIMAVNKLAGAFSEADMSLMTTLASFAGVAIANAQLFEASQNRLKEMALLVNASTTLSTSLNMQALFANVARQIIASTHTHSFSYSTWERARNTVTTVLNFLAEGGEETDAPGTVYLLADFPATRLALENREATMVSLLQPDADKYEVSYLEKVGYAALVMVPLVARNEVTGLLEFFSKIPDAYTEVHMTLFQTLANQMAAATENARLFDEIQKHATELEGRVTERTTELEVLYLEQTKLVEAERSQRELAETLREAGAIVASTLDMEHAIQQILPQLARVIPYDSASVQLLTDGTLEIVGGRGWVQYNTVLGYRFPVPGPNPNSLVVEQKRPIILNSQELILFDEFQKTTHGNIQSWLGIPLIVQDEVIGMLTLDSVEPQFFNETHALLAEAFADQVAVAIEQAQLFKRTQSAVDELEALRAIIAEITDELELPKLLESVLERASALIDSTSGLLALYNEESYLLEVVAAHNMGDDVVGNTLKLGQGLLGQVAETRAPLILENYADWEHALENWRGGPWHATMAVPLIYHQRLVGVMALTDMRPDHRFSASDSQLLELFSHQVSIAIENAQLFRQVQLLATTDDLTGLPNWRELFNLGREQFNQAKRFNLPFAAIMFDIDLFKKVNDSHGHAIGDQVLKGIAQICLQKVRDIDVLSRYGGEEFTALLPHTNLPGAVLVAERLRLAVEQTPIPTDRGPLSITISLGVAALSPEQENLAELLDKADTALYHAKNSGRNNVQGIQPGQ